MNTLSQLEIKTKKPLTELQENQFDVWHFVHEEINSWIGNARWFKFESMLMCSAKFRIYWMRLNNGFLKFNLYLLYYGSLAFFALLILIIASWLFVLKARDSKCKHALTHTMTETCCKRKGMERRTSCIQIFLLCRYLNSA